MTDIVERPSDALESIGKPAMRSGLPEPKTFDDVAEERLYRKQRLAGALRIMGNLRLAEGVAGHVTVRDPEDPTRFWVNPFGRNFKLMRVSDLICVDHDGNVVEGTGILNQAAFAIHSGIHAARPDVVAAAHSHSMYGRTFSAMGQRLKMISQDATAFYQDWAIHKDGGGAVVLDPEAGKKMAETLGERKALIHQNHGLITVGGSVDSAVWWFILLERLCQSQLVAEAAGSPIEIAPELCEQGRKQQGGEFSGWFQFQPFWDELVSADTEFLQ